MIETELERHLRKYRETEWDWMDNAMCVSVDPEMFYAEKGKFSTPKTKQAIRICRECPVIKECLTWAFKTGDQYAVLGGMTPPQRTRYRREIEYIKVLRAMEAERGR